MYCLYAYGIPILITLLVFVIEEFEEIPDELKAGIGKKRCWIKANKLTELVYLFGPICCLLIFNVAFYAITAYKIYDVQNQTQIKGDNVRHGRALNAEKMRFVGKSFLNHFMQLFISRFMLYLRLFIIMGVTWSFEILSWAFDGKLSWVLIIVDGLNCLQGVIIFIFFVWQPKIKKKIIGR